VRIMGVTGTKNVHAVGSQEGGEHDNVGRSRELVFGWIV